MARLIHVNPGAFSQDVPAALVESAARRTLAAEGIEEGEVSVTFLGDDAIRELNRSYLGKDAPTDVISFSLGEKDRPLGDVYIGLRRAMEQSEEHGVSLDEELARLTIHGTLHVLGHDHPQGPERLQSPMFVLQERLLREVMSSPDAPGQTS